MGCFWSQLDDDDYRPGSVHRTRSINKPSYDTSRFERTNNNLTGLQNRSPAVTVKRYLQVPSTNQLANEKFTIPETKSINRVISERSKLCSDNQSTNSITKQTLQKCENIKQIVHIKQKPAFAIEPVQLKELPARPKTSLQQYPAKPITSLQQYPARPNGQLKEHSVRCTEPVKQCLPITGTISIVPRDSFTSKQFRSKTSASSTSKDTTKINAAYKTTIENRLDNEANKDKPKYGEYKCNNCGRHWNSRLCWPEKYQVCKYCKERVFPDTHRELEVNDLIEDKDKAYPHEEALCQMCQKLGYYCGNFNKVYKRQLLSKKQKRN